jgi:hypothetical protein
MSGKALARVALSTDRPRGPDAQLAVTVPESFLLEGATIEVEVPRNLSCATCGGGGCDACERSGAVSARGRNDPVEKVEITLPKPAPKDDGATAPRAVILRIPEHGGLAAAESNLPRGNLLLTVRAGETLSKGVTRLPGPSVPPPDIAPELVGVEGEAAENARIVWLFVVAVLCVLMAWWLRR